MSAGISIHAPPRGATLSGVLFCTAPYFNSRPSARGDFYRQGADAQSAYFNSRPSARGDSHFPPSTTERGVFQFTPLREGRQIPPQVCYESRIISIHAPPRGATTSAHLRANSKKNFNSRPSARGDVSSVPHDFFPVISIHAPPRGATFLLTDRLGAEKFQFTPLREGRQNHMAGLAKRADFNSRPSARGDISTTLRYCERTRFQFTPLREGRLRLPCDSIVHLVFQFTPLREGRRVSIATKTASSDFNSRPSARGDHRRHRPR